MPLSAVSSEAPPGKLGPATVVLAQRVRPGRETEYLHWQEEMNARARSFAGFRGTDIIPPVAGLQDEFVIVYRFDTFDHLDAWIRSDARHEWLERGAPLFEAEATTQVLATPDRQGESVSMLVSTRVKHGREREYREWQKEMDRATAKFAGFQGTELFPPVAGQQDAWGVVVRFDCGENLQRWLDSDERKRLIERGEPLFDDVQLHTVSSGFAGWFSLAGNTATSALPPPWKQAMIVLLALYPTVMLLTWTLSPHLQSMPFPLSMFVSNACSVALLNWLVVPGVNHIFTFWLDDRPRSRAVEIGGTCLVAGAYAVAVAFFLSSS